MCCDVLLRTSSKSCVSHQISRCVLNVDCKAVQIVLLSPCPLRSSLYLRDFCAARTRKSVPVWHEFMTLFLKCNMHPSTRAPLPGAQTSD